MSTMALRRSAKPRLIVALDVDSLAKATALVDLLSPLRVTFKVGYEALFGFGEALRAHLEEAKADVFIDAKLHDIPRTVGAAVRALVRPGVQLLTVHALGGDDMMREAVAAAEQQAASLGVETPKIFAVTILTSIARETLPELGLTGGPGENVIRLAALARDARCAGVVCAVSEVRDLKSYFGAEFSALCPGIRPLGTAHDDQRRIATPREAVVAGSDYLVVGRPIVESRDPLAATQSVLDEIQAACDDL